MCEATRAICPPRGEIVPEEGCNLFQVERTGRKNLGPGDAIHTSIKFGPKPARTLRSPVTGIKTVLFSIG